MFGAMTAINTISKHTDKLWVVGVVAGAICGVTKGLYDRKNYNSISGFAKGVPKTIDLEDINPMENEALFTDMRAEGSKLNEDDYAFEDQFGEETEDSEEE